MHNYVSAKRRKVIKFGGTGNKSKPWICDPWARDKKYKKLEREDDRYSWQKQSHLNQIKSLDYFLSVYIYI